MARDTKLRKGRNPQAALVPVSHVDGHGPWRPMAIETQRPVKSSKLAVPALHFGMLTQNTILVAFSPKAKAWVSSD